MKTNDNEGDICQRSNYERQVREDRGVKRRKRTLSEEKTTKMETYR